MTWALLRCFPLGKKVFETKKTQTPITFSMWFWQKILGFNRQAYWPTHISSKVLNPKNIWAGIETAPGYMPGCYIQGIGKIRIGSYTQIGPNVGIISTNHDPEENQKHSEHQEVTIGEYCWIGMNAVILPGVSLGDFTVVGAGSVVTKSFPEGYCVIGGNPAKIIRKTDPQKCVRFKSPREYFGYIPREKFESFRKKHLSV